MFQWLGLGAFTAKGSGSIPGWGTKIPQAMGCGQKKKSSMSCTPELWTYYPSHTYTHTHTIFYINGIINYILFIFFIKNISDNFSNT